MSTTINFVQGPLERITYLTHGASLTHIQQFAEFLEAYTVAGINQVTYTEGQLLAIAEDTPENPIGLHAQLHLRDQSNMKLYALIIPAPRISLFENFAEGERVIKAKGDLIAAQYSVMAGKTLVFEEGWLGGTTK